MLLDSNIIIYAAQAENAGLRQLIADNAPSVSVISMVEVLGYHRLKGEARKYFEEFFAASTLLPVTDSVIARAVSLKQTRKMTLGDSLVAATAIVNNRVLITRNSTDFEWIAELKVINPFGELPTS